MAEVVMNYWQTHNSNPYRWLLSCCTYEANGLPTRQTIEIVGLVSRWTELKQLVILAQRAALLVEPTYHKERRALLAQIEEYERQGRLIGVLHLYRERDEIYTGSRVLMFRKLRAQDEIERWRERLAKTEADLEYLIRSLGFIHTEIGWVNMRTGEKVA